MDEKILDVKMNIDLRISIAEYKAITECDENFRVNAIVNALINVSKNSGLVFDTVILVKQLINADQDTYTMTTTYSGLR